MAFFFVVVFYLCLLLSLDWTNFFFLLVRFILRHTICVFLVSIHFWLNVKIYFMNNQVITVPHEFQWLPLVFLFSFLGFLPFIESVLLLVCCYFFSVCLSTNFFFAFFFLCVCSESNSLSPPFFTGTTNGTTQKGRPRKRKLMINHHQNDPLNLGTAMQMGT